MNGPEPGFPRALSGRYHPLELLSAGAGGAVFRCRDAKLERTVIVKLLATDREDPDSRARSDREGRTLSALSHPHIVRIFDVGEVEGTPFLVMEHLEGTTLAAHIRTTGQLAEPEAAAIALSLARALGELHTRGMLHRDLKPLNTVLVAERGPVLIDFGLAKATDVSIALTRSGELMGTPLYIAPEIVAGKPATAASDIYALGMTLYEMLAGRPAFPPGDLFALLAAQVNQAPPPVAGITPAMAVILDRCLAKIPQDRFESADQLAAALADTLTATAPPPRSRPRAPSRPMPPPVTHPETADARTMALAAPAERLAGHAPWRGRALGRWLAVGLGLVAAMGMLASRGTRPPAAGTARASPRVLPILDLTVRPIERSIYAHFRTTEQVRVTVRAVDEAGSVREATTAQGYLHRAVLERLTPGRSYRIELTAPAPDRVAAADAVLVRTHPPGLRAKVVGHGSFGDRALDIAAQVTKDPTPVVLATMDQVDDSDLTWLLSKLDEPRAPVRWAIQALGILGAPAATPRLAKLLETDSASLAVASRIRDALSALGKVGGPEAVRALVQFCHDGLARARPPLAGERHALRQHAARALARVDPGVAGDLFSKLRRGMEYGDREDAGCMALVGAGFLRPQWLGAELERAIGPASAVERRADLPAAVRVATRVGGSGADRLLARLLEMPAVSAFDRYCAVLGLGTWGTARSVDPLVELVARGLKAGCTYAAPDETAACYVRVRALQSLGMIAARAPAPVRSDIAHRLVASLTSGSPTERRFALRALAQTGVPETAAAIEDACARDREPRSEFALALARSRSGRALEAISAAAVGGRPTDLWLCAVAAATHGGPGSGELVERCRSALSSISKSHISKHIDRSFTWLGRNVSAADVTWVDPSAPWVPALLELSPGDRFSIEAHGVVAYRFGRSAALPAWLLPSFADETEPAANVFFIRADASGLESTGLAARVGQFDLPFPVEPGRVYTAQDSGPLLVQFRVGGAYEPADLADKFAPATAASFRWAGLVLVKGERVPGNSSGGGDRDARAAVPGP